MFRQLLGAAFAAALLVIPAFAHETYKIGGLEISKGYSRATLPNAPVGGGYLTIVNTGAEDDTLLSASSPVAGSVSLHKTMMEGDTSKMTDSSEGVVIPAGGTVMLEPGGLHLMFNDLKQRLIEQETVPVTLRFARAGTIDIVLVIGTVNAKEPEHRARHN